MIGTCQSSIMGSSILGANPSNMQTGWLVACKYNASCALGSRRMTDRPAYEMGALPAQGPLLHISRPQDQCSKNFAS